MQKKTLSAENRTSKESEVEVFEEFLDTKLQDIGIEHIPEVYSSENTATTSIDQASKAIQLNIQLNGADAGIQLTKRLADECNIPFVLLDTDSKNRSTAAASITIPNDYLISSKETLIGALSETVLKNRSEEHSKVSTENKLARITEAIFVKGSINYTKVLFQDIDFVKSDGNYIEIHWIGKKSVLKKTLKSIEEKLPSQTFFQLHRSYMVNINKISSIGPNHVTVNQQKIPISKGKKEVLLAILNTVC